MPEFVVDTPAHHLEPLPYHIELRDYLKSRERELWNWFASAQAQEDYTETLRTDLLKSTYRLDADSHPELYQSVAEARERLSLDIPVTVYQAQSSPLPNATLFFMPGEGHVVLSGPILSLLDAQELKSVLGHELAHHHLWGRDDGEFHVADRLLQAVANDPRAATSHEQSARRYQLYTEVFADRGSLCVSGDVHPVVAGLVKVETGLSKVSAAGYVQQAEEIFSKGDVATQGHSHPELFIRARALALWQVDREAATPRIRAMIEGTTAMEELDLIGQGRLFIATRRLLEDLLRPRWFQTPAVLGHAKLFFDDFQPTNGSGSVPPDELKANDPRLQEYLSYVLLDFATVDPDLEDLPLAAALEQSRQLELDAVFEKLAAKELKRRVRDVRKLKEQAAELLAQAEATE